MSMVLKGWDLYNKIIRNRRNGGKKNEKTNRSGNTLHGNDSNIIYRMRIAKDLFELKMH